jgi:hypothetical protein
MQHHQHHQDTIHAMLDRLAAERPSAYAQIIAQPFGAIPAHVADEGPLSTWWTSDDAAALAETLAEALAS